MSSNDLRLIVLDTAKELGEKVNKNLQEIRNTDENFIVPVNNVRFSNGEGKVRIEETVRDKDLYILSDVGNYGITYKLHGMVHNMSPDEHFQDIKRVISATSGHAGKVTVVMPLLYQARQHKRKGRESLDCAIALQELEKLGVDDIITFDAHDPNVANAIPKLPFESFYPTYTILDILIDNEDVSNLIVVSPDMGAMERTRYYAEMLGCDAGVFYKRRDLSKVVDGKNPIVEHIYMGVDVTNKNIIVVDDMISSGQSMIEVASELKKRGAKNIYLVATFALFTEGADMFRESYARGEFTKLYSTNLSYVPEDVTNEEWFVNVDCSLQIASILNNLNAKESIHSILHYGKNEIFERMERKKHNQ